MSKKLKVGAAVLLSAVAVRTLSDVVTGVVKWKRAASATSAASEQDPKEPKALSDTALQTDEPGLTAASDKVRSENPRTIKEDKADDTEPVAERVKTICFFFFFRPPDTLAHKLQTMPCGIKAFGENEL